MAAVAWVFLGGGLGSVCRFLLARWLGNAGHFPWGTFIANSLACFLLGILTVYVSRALMVNPQARLLLVTGFCGGFSTFSTYSLELVQLIREGQTTAALIYGGASLFVGMGAIFLAILLLETD